MPETPIDEQQVSPQVQPSAELPMDATPEAFGAGIGSALETGGEVATKLHHDAWEQANETALIDAKNKNDQFLNARLYDAKSGLYNQELGKSAPGAVDKTLADFDKHTAGVESALTNDQQKLAYRRTVVAQRFDLERQLNAYEHRETTRYADETDSAQMANAATQASHLAASYVPTYVEHADGTKTLNNTEDITDQIGAGQAAIASRGQRKGQAPEFIQEQQDHYASEVHRSAIEQMSAVGNDQAAKLWYDHFKDDLVGNDAERAARMVEAGSTNGQALRISDQIVLDKDGTGILPRAEIDARVRQIQDPNVREKVQQNVDRRLAQEREAHEEQQRALTDQTMQIAQDSKLGINDPQVQTNLQNLDVERQQAVKRFAQRDTPVVQADPAAMRAIQIGLADPATRKDFIGFDPTAHPDKYGREDMTKIADWQATYIKGGDKADKEMAGTLSRAGAVQNALVASGLGGASKQDKADAQTAIDQQVVAIENATGKKMLPDEVQKAATALLVKRAYYGEHFWNFNQRASKFMADQLDPAERKQLVDALTASGLSPSDENVLTMFRANLGRQAIRGENGK